MPAGSRKSRQKNQGGIKMTRYKKGTIKSMADIIFEKEMIVSGNVNKTCWVWRMPGEFKRKGNEVIFENMHGITSTVDEKIDLAIIARGGGKYDD